MGIIRADVDFHFLSDDPGMEDGFSGKGHDRSARALAGAIVKLSGSDCAIGLEGGWGSGKTTVVAMAQNQLQQSDPDKFTFFTFDLWSNQSVDFRRAFLEEFLKWSKTYLKDHEYKDLEGQIQGKTKTVETQNERQFSNFGYLLMATLFLLPFLILWLSPLSVNLHRPLPGTSPTSVVDNAQLPWIFNLLYSGGHWAAMILIGTVLIGFIIQTLHGWRCKGKTLREALDASFSLFSRKSEKDVVIQTIRDGDPTQYEFHKIFTNILSKVQGKERRVIFVVDNIDRLPANRIQEMWANVRAIFSKNGSEQDIRSSVTTVVVPYDRAQVLAAFESPQHTSPDVRKEDKEPKTGDRENIKSAYLLEDVVRKTFSAVVTVCPPITSHVKAFFDRCLDESLPNQVDGRQKYRLFSIFDFFLADKSINPTPRQVKSFINDIGMLKYQWLDKVSIESIAIFVLHRSMLESNPRLLQRSDTINARYRHFAAQEGLDKELAALAYNVEPDDALEVLLMRDITAALISPSSERLLKLAGSAGFHHQLEQILHKKCSDWAAESIEFYEFALTNYCALPVNNDVNETCNRHFVSAIPRLAKFEITSWELHPALFKLASCMPKAALSTHIANLVNWINGLVPENSTTEHGREWIRFIGGFLGEVGKLHGEDVVASLTGTIKIPHSLDFYLGVAIDCNEVNLQFAQFEHAAIEYSQDLTASIAECSIEEPSFFTYLWNEFKFLLDTDARISLFSKLMEHVQSNVLEKKNERAYNIKSLTTISLETQFQPKIAQSIKAAICDGALPWHASKLNEENDWANLARAIWLASIPTKAEVLPALVVSNKAPFGEVGATHQWFTKCYADEIPADAYEMFVELIIRYDNVDEWVSTFAKSPKHAMHRIVLAEVFKSDNCPSLKLVTLTEHYDFLKKQFDNELVTNIVKKVGESITKEIMDVANISKLPTDLVKDIEDIEQAGWIALLSRVDQYLKNLTSEQWESALQEDTHDRQLLVARRDALKNSIPPNQLLAPLADFLANIMTTKPGAAQVMHHSPFLSVLTKHTRLGIAKDVVERIEGKPVNPDGLVLAFDAFNDLSATFPVKGQSEICVTKILLPLLGINLDKALQLVESNTSAWNKCVSEVEADTLATLDEYLSAYDDQDEKVKVNADKLRKLLKRPRKEANRPESDHS